MPTAKEYRDFIRGQKDKRCKPYSKLDKEGLRILAIKMGWTKLNPIQRQAESKMSKKRRPREVKEEKEVKMGSVDEMKKQVQVLTREYEALRKKAEEASATGRGYQKLIDDMRLKNRERFALNKKIKIRSGAVVQR